MIPCCRYREDVPVQRITRRRLETQTNIPVVTGMGTSRVQGVGRGGDGGERSRGRGRGHRGEQGWRGNSGGVMRGANRDSHEGVVGQQGYGGAHGRGVRRPGRGGPRGRYAAGSVHGYAAGRVHGYAAGRVHDGGSNYRGRHFSRSVYDRYEYHDNYLQYQPQPQQYGRGQRNYGGKR